MWRIRTLATLLGLMAACSFSPAAWADDGGAEAVLASKGLVREGNFYLLPKVEDAIKSLGIENMQLEFSGMRVEIEAMEKMNRAMDDKRRAAGTGSRQPFGQANPAYPNTTMPSPMGDPGQGPGFPPGGASAGGVNDRQGRVMTDLGRLPDDEMIKRLIAGKAGVELLNIKERQTVNAFLFHKLLDQYNTLAADPAVRAALREVNKGRSPKLAVGPPPAYNLRLVAQAVDTLRDKGLHVNKGSSTFSTVADDDVSRMTSDLDRARLQYQDLEKSSARGESKLADLIRLRKQLSKDLSPGSPPKAGLAAQLRVIDAQVEKLKADDPVRQLAEAATRRADFLKQVRELRQKAEDARRRRKAALADPEVKEALADLDKYRSGKQKHKVVVGRKFDDNLKHLAAIEDSIEAVEVALEPDRDMLWVDAGLNGAKGRKVVVDPKAAFVRLSAKAAAEAGVKLDDALAVEVTSDDGRSFRASRAMLRSLQVGPFAARDVVCLVMPETFGDAPTILGGSFLHHFVADVNSAAARLTLERINPHPPAKANP